jgi:Tol biopolymer transport system component
MAAGERRWMRLMTAIIVAALFAPGAVQAQYFGRNQVRYRSYDFKVLATEHFDVYYYPGEAKAAVDAARMAERWYSRLSRLMDNELSGRQPFILYDTHSAYNQTNIAQVAGSEGVTEPLRRRVLLPSQGPLAETDHVIGHELVHAFQYNISGVDPTTPLYGAPAISGLPGWMIEGMAEYLSKGPNDPLTATWVRDALRSDKVKLPNLRDLDNSYKYFPYRWGEALWAYIGGVWGDTAVQRIYKTALRTGRAGTAIQIVTGLPADTVVQHWHDAIKKEWGPLLTSTKQPDAFGQTIISGPKDVVYNVAPAVSPDGKRLAFLSARSRYSMDLYLADARTGQIIRQVTKTALDPHLQSLQYSNSAGSWAPDNRRFALAAVSGSHPVLSIMDMDTGDKVKELSFKDLGEIFNPTWSPDGRRIAFVANVGGLLDLYVVDLESGQLTRLTQDPYTELEPSWSPDGSRIAFVTDRFGAQLDELKMGHYRLATIDPAGGDIQPLPSFDQATNINPGWAPDGHSLYFVSDPTGIPNVYRADVSTGEIRQVTNVLGGVGGITELSPAISVATGTGEVVFSAFTDGAFGIYRIEDRQVLAGREPSATAEEADAGALPPRRRAPSEVATLLANARLGLPDAATFERRDYNSALGLDYVAQPSLGAGVSSFGSYIGGGAALMWGDMLGNHSLITQLQLQIINGNVVNGLGGLVTYVNRTHRLNWGVQAGQVPQFSQYYAGGYAQQGNQVVYVEQTYNFWQTDRRALALAIYPLSSVMRLEFQGGFQQLGFHAETQTQIFDAATFQRLSSNTVNAPACGDSLSFFTNLCDPGNLNEATGSAALVFDNSISGPTGPILGQRFRLEADPSAGTLNYVSALADLREYLMPVWPITLAGRAMHYGRYGSGAGDDRLGILFLGYPTLVRGYDYGSFSTANCDPNVPLGQCSEIKVYNELFGSRMAVANAELRLPITGPIGLAHTGMAVPPLDLFGFFDAGVTWGRNPLTTSYQKLSTNYAVTSAGFGGRVNMFGFAVFEVYWVKPFERTDKGSYVGFALTPAF